jgi:hypothetical protein
VAIKQVMVSITAPRDSGDGLLAGDEEQARAARTDKGKDKGKEAADFDKGGGGVSMDVVEREVAMLQVRGTLTIL